MEDYPFDCPYCGSAAATAIDPSGGRRQSFVTDCPACCRPIVVTAVLGAAGVESFSAVRE